MWILLLSRATDPPGSFFDRRQIDAGQIKLGRSAKVCDLVLPDEEGFISREHCTIIAQGLELYVTDISKNGVALNDPAKRIAPNLPVPIRPNDRLLIGSFVVTITTEAGAAAFAAVPPPAQGLPMSFGSNEQDPWLSPGADPIWDAGPSGGAMHDFLNDAVSDMLSSRGASAPIPPGPSDFGFSNPLEQAFSRPIMAEPMPTPQQFGIPENWDLSDPAPAPAAPAPWQAAPEARPLSSDEGPRFDDVLPDPFDLSTPPAGVPPLTPPPAFEPARPSSASSGAGPAGPDAAWQAFFEGAGLSPDEVTLSPDAMRRLGVMYRQVVLGLWDIIQDRASFKDEFRVERTQLSMGRNNPLKHLPPLDAARILLGEPLPGFMSAEEALRSAFEDIKKHQLAMLAGVQQALTAVFDRLSPGEIEKMIEKAAAQKKGLFGRGIDRWSVYLTIFEALRRDATTNANGVMSVAFREGYETFLKSTH